MIIIGAKGFAKEVLEVLHQQNDLENLVFYDDINLDRPMFLYDKFTILKSISEAKKHFDSVDKRFTIGIGKPVLRKKLYDKFTEIGGKFVSLISPHAIIGHFGNTIGEGCNIMAGTIITNDVIINKGVLVNLNCTIGHDCEIGNFVEMSPGVHISGNCFLGDYSVIGTNASVLPKIKIGKNVIVGAGSVVTKNLPDNCVAVGIPAKVIKELPALEF
jgi:sugar O-acyltransferase (sialic acid O-acetyltransferase NeuD family)